MAVSASELQDTPRARRISMRVLLVAAVVIGIVSRVSFLAWQDPWTPHHADEHILPLEALALWEGVTPREVGWPASTTRLLLSGMAATEWMSQQGATAWQLRHQPDQVLDLVASWISQQYADPSTVYRLGRSLSMATGVLQLLIALWALGRWSGGLGQVAGTFGAAVAPLAVLYSQFILSDITGLLFATAVVGFAARPTPRRVLIMAGLAGLAAASKLYFGLWLLTPLVSIFFLEGSQTTPRDRVRLALGALSIFACVVILFVPWWLINPVLALKELGGTAVTKVGETPEAAAQLAKLPVLFGGVGVLIWLGAALGLAQARTLIRTHTSVLVPLIAGVLLLLRSAVVADRYALVLVPGLLVLSASGWQHWLSHPRRSLQRVAWVALGISAVVGSQELIRAAYVAAETDVDVQTKRWIMSHVPRGQRVALYDEWLVLIPRTADQLRSCAAYTDTLAAYREKWSIQGWSIPGEIAQPMRSAILADELFAAYWCRRELAVQNDPGYVVVPYHGTPRFGSILEQDALAVFRDQPAGGARTIDVLVLNRPADVGVPPAHSIQTQRGQRVIYLRQGPGSR